MAGAPDLRVRERERNPSRTRELILDAAEQLFAEQGYDATSLTDVGRIAGVSRATPGYFFGSKAELKRAVLERCFEAVRSAVREGRERTGKGRHSPEVILAGAVSDYFDFVAARPNFVKLVEREALDDRRGLDGLPLGLATGQEMVAALAQELELPPGRHAEIAEMVFSLMALSWFPHIHGHTLGRVAGVRPASADFLERRKRHATELLLGWLRAQRAA